MYYEDIRLTQPFQFSQCELSHLEHDVHVHDCLEINIVVKNRVENRFGEQVYIGHPGDVFICRPFEPHWGRSHEPKQANWIMLLFTSAIARMIPGGIELLIPFYTQMLPTPIIPTSDPHAVHIMLAAQDALDLSDLPEDVRQTKTFIRLIEILLHIYQFAKAQKNCRYSQTEFDGIVSVVNYMITHYKEEIAARQLMNVSGLGKTKFFESFHNVTGTTPNDFLIKLRVQDAIDALLRKANQSILQICEESGFQSLRTFNKRFKEYTGSSPSDFRKRPHRI